MSYATLPMQMLLAAIISLMMLMLFRAPLLMPCL